jgi:hypothetical protein
MAQSAAGIVPTFVQWALVKVNKFVSVELRLSHFQVFCHKNHVREHAET